jgi:hypothetical protein
LTTIPDTDYIGWRGSFRAARYNLAISNEELQQMKHTLILLILSGSLWAQVRLDSTNLPLFIITTNGQSIPDGQKISAGLKIIDNGVGTMNRPADIPTGYNGGIGIEIRGASSASYPQKPYGFETRDSLGNNLNVALLGMPPENDWTLTTCYNEKSFVRSILGFDLFRNMGHYSVRPRLCEVILNTTYQGIYLCTEKIKRDKNRVAISELLPTDNAGDSLSGGYIIKLDYHNDANSWVSSFRPLGHPDKSVYYVYYYPQPDEITTPQKTYIKKFLFDLETALYSERFWDPTVGYRNYIDVASFIDYFIVSEVSRNVDGYKKSRFFYKDRDSKGGLLCAGPVWDLDWAWKNINECIYSATDGSGWSYKTNDCGPDVNDNGWYVRLLQDGYFTNRLIDRYTRLRADLITENRLFATIDSVRTMVNSAQKRHFALWPIDQGYMAPEVDAPSRSYDQEIAKLKEWIHRRLVWLDSNIPKLRAEITVEAPDSLSAMNDANRHFPAIRTSGAHITMYNVLGQQVFDATVHSSYSPAIDIRAFKPGLYYTRIKLTSGTTRVYKTVFCR